MMKERRLVSGSELRAKLTNGVHYPKFIMHVLKLVDYAVWMM